MFQVSEYSVVSVLSVVKKGTLMRIALGSDERTHLTDLLAAELARRGHTLVVFGPPAGEPASWPDVAEAVARRVATGECAQGILCCWTGTGVSIAANKVPGAPFAAMRRPPAAHASGMTPMSSV